MRSEEVDLETGHDGLPTLGIMRLAEEGGAFDWLAEEEDLYTVEDLKVRYPLKRGGIGMSLSQPANLPTCQPANPNAAPLRKPRSGNCP